MKYSRRVTRFTVSPDGDELYSERCTNIEIVDHGAGEFVRISQQSTPDSVESQTICIGDRDIISSTSLDEKTSTQLPRFFNLQSGS